MDQVVEQKMSYIQSKVEEILYNYVGIAKPIKKEKLPSEALEVDIDLLPTDLEQVSPDSDKKSLPDAMDIEEEVEEEIVEDEDFESPAFEPIEAIMVEKNDNSNLSAISGLTSQDSLENKSDPSPSEPQQETQLSQISSVQDMMSQEASETPAASTVADVTPTAEPPAEAEETAKEEPEKSNFDLKKDSIEFTGTERKSISLEDSSNVFEPQKVLQPQDVPSNTMEIDNLYENDTTDSSEARMEIDLKDETTQGTLESTKIEESSQDSTVSKGKSHSEPKKDSRRHHHKSDRSRDKHKSSSSSHKSRHHQRSSSSKSHHDHRKSDGKSSSSSHKRSSNDKDRSSSSRRDHEKKSSRDDATKSKDSKHKSDDHHQEKSSRRRRSTDHDSNEGKGDKLNLTVPTSTTVDTKSETDKKIVSSGTTTAEDSQVQEATESKPVSLDKMLSEHCEISLDSRSSTSSSTKKEHKSSILIKYDYLKSANKPTSKVEKIEDGFCGFAVEKLPVNPWFDCLRKESAKRPTKKANRLTSNNNYLEQTKLDKSISIQIPKTKAKPKAKQLIDSPSETTDASKLPMETEESSSESRAQSIAQQQRYNSDDLYKPRFDFGYRSRRRGQVTEEAPDEAQGSKTEDSSSRFQDSKQQ